MTNVTNACTVDRASHSRPDTVARSDGLRVAILGATGAVGRTLLDLFDERDFAYEQLFLIASARSAGKVIQHKGVDHLVYSLDDFDFKQVDLVFSSAGSGTSREWGRRIAAQGPYIIDNTNAFRMDDDISLVVPQVNCPRLADFQQSRIIANPNCTTIPMVRALHPIHKAYGLERIVVSTYQAASGGGVTGLEQFTNGSRQILENPDAVPEAGRFHSPLPFNLVPCIDEMLDNGFTLEEKKIAQESRKILGLPNLKVSATAVRVPVMNCHSEAVYFECSSPMEQSKLIDLLEDSDEITLHSGHGGDFYPTPRLVSDTDHVHVGRVRVDPDNTKAGWLWVVSDNLRVGAALNAIQIAERMVNRSFA